MELMGILRGAAITLLGNVLGGVLLFLGEILAARFLGVQSYGLYTLAFVLARIGCTLSLFGIGIGILHYLPIYRNRGQTKLIVGSVLASLVPPLGIGCAASVLIWQLSLQLATNVFHEPSAAPYIRTIALSIPLMALSENLAIITRAYGHSIYYVIVRNLLPPTTFLLLLLWIKSIDAASIYVAWAFVISCAVALVAGVLSVIKVLGSILWEVRPIIPFRNLYTYSFPVLVHSLLCMIMQWADILILASYQTPDRVGIYRACMQVVIPFDLIVFGFNAVTAPIYSTLSDENKLAELSRTYSAATEWITMLVVPAFLIVALNGRDILSLVGPHFSEGAVALSILSFAQVVKCCLGSAGFVLVLGRRQILETANAAMAGVVNILLNLILISRFGIVGAAVAMASSELILNLMRALQVRYLLGLIPLGLSHMRIHLIGFLVGFAVISGSFLFGIGNGTGFGSMIARVLGTGALFSFALWQFGLSRTNKLLLKGALHSLIAHNRPEPV